MLRSHRGNPFSRGITTLGNTTPILRYFPHETICSISDAQKKVSEILKRVDQLIKAGDIDKSVREIIRAREIDPKRGYIRAYEERLAYLKEEHEKNIAHEKTRKEAEDAARKRDEELQKCHEEERRRLEEEQKRLDDERKREEEHIKADLERSQRSKTNQPASDHKSRRITAAGPSNASSGGRLPEGSQLDSEAPQKSDAEVILLIDDEEQMLDMLSQILVYSGYETKSFGTSDEAYVLLKKWKPHLILCDINLETSTMGGFSFYEKVRTLDHLHDVPFVFLTGMNDEVLVRTAKKLGVDDYLTKPISIENLLATIKGKLKRFGTFREKP